MTSAARGDSRHGGRILADQLKIQGCDRVFLVPGESYLAVLDGLYDVPEIQPVVCRQEGGAAMMADAYGKLTGRPGICFVTRGPGATNASAGVHIAFQDSTPMILFIGQVGRDMIDREAFQEVDYRQMFAPLAKWAAQIDSVERIPEYISHAYHVAMSGRPGPVVLALPEDMLTEVADVADAKPANPGYAKPNADDMASFADMLAKAERPMMVLGGPGWSDEARKSAEAFSSRTGLPVCTSFRAQDYFDNDHAHYAGHSGIGPIPSLGEAIREADLLIVVGARMGEMTSGGYTQMAIPNPKQTLIHVHPDGSELGRVYRPDLAIVASTSAFAAALDQVELSGARLDPTRTAALNKGYRDSLVPLPTPGDVRMEDVLAHVADTLPPDAIVTNGAGNYAGWVHRYYRFRTYRTQLAPTSGSMGYGMPAAVAAKLTAPDREVICFAGDGCFMMHGQELSTAARHDLDLTVIVSNNGTYGTIRMHQEREYPNRVSGTDLSNPNFAKLAEAYGALGIRVEKSEDFPDAFAKARAHKGPALIELMTSAEAISVSTTITKLRERAK